MDGPSDANYILISEIILMSLFLMNAADRVLQPQGIEHYRDTGSFAISGLIAPTCKTFTSVQLEAIERTAWWVHIGGIFAFPQLPAYSKHLHILLAFPNAAYYARLTPAGQMSNMEHVQNEVKYMMQPELAPTDYDAAR